MVVLFLATRLEVIGRGSLLLHLGLLGGVAVLSLLIRRLGVLLEELARVWLGRQVYQCTVRVQLNRDHEAADPQAADAEHHLHLALLRDGLWFDAGQTLLVHRLEAVANRNLELRRVGLVILANGAVVLDGIGRNLLELVRKRLESNQNVCSVKFQANQ